MASRDLKVTLIGDNQTGKAFGSAAKDADGFGSKMASLGKVAAVGLAGAAAGFGVFAKSGVDAFARVEDAIGVSGVMFGDSARRVQAFAQAASSSFGLSTGAALDAANTFATTGKAAGLSGEDLAGFSEKFVGLAGDLASFKGTSPEQAVEAIGAAMRGETEPIRAFGVAIDDAALRNEALAQGLISSTKDALTPQQKALAAAALIYKQTGDAQGDFQRTSDSTANTAKRLAAETENASARLGEQLAPAVTAAREAFLGLIQGASGFIERIGPVVGQAQVAFSAFFAALREGDVTSDGLVGKFEMVGDALHRFGISAIPIAVAGFHAFAAAAKSVGEALMATVIFFREHDTAAKALGVVVALVAAGVAVAWVAQAGVATANAARSVAAWFATATASTTSATIQSKSTAQIVVGWIAHAAGATVNAAKVVAGWVLTSAGAVAAGVVMVAQTALHVAKWAFLGAQSLLHAAKVAAAWLIAMGPIGLVIAAVVGVVALIVANWDTIRAKTEELWNAVKAATGAAWDWIKSAVKTGIDFLVGLFMNFTGPGLIIKHWDTIKAATSAAWDAVKGFVSGGVEAVTGFIGSLPGKAAGALSSLASTLSGVARGAWDAFTGAVRAGIDTALGVVQGLAGRVSSAVSGFGSLLVNAGRELMSGLARGIGEKISAVIDKVRAAAQRIKDLLPGSPVKTGPLTAWNNGGAGKRLMGMLAGGIDAASDLPGRAMERAVDFGDLAGMQVGGTSFVNRRLGASPSSAETAPVRPQMSSTDALLAEQNQLLREQNELLRRAPREYLAGQRQMAGAF